MTPTSFDGYAKFYDRHFTNTSIGRAQRAQVHAAFIRLNLRPSRILEINCGTGEDAIFLHRLGHLVTATDVSPEMVKVAKEKLFSLPISVLTAGFHQLNDIQFQAPFHVVFSNFGGLNCISKQEIVALKKDLLNCTEAEAYLFFVVMSSECWWEKLYFIWKRQTHMVNRRQAIQVPGPINNNTFQPTTYYSPDDLANLFTPEFSVAHIFPVGFFVPPSYLQPFFDRHERWLQLLKWLDSKVKNISWLSNRSDHYIIVLKKK